MVVWLRGLCRWVAWSYTPKDRCPYCRTLVRAREVRRVAVLGRVCRHCLEGRWRVSPSPMRARTV